MRMLNSDWKEIEWILTDVDDTLTYSGQLPPCTLVALQKLKNAGKKIVAVTGACTGWADHMAQLWPVDAVISENGAIILEKKEGVLTRRGYTPLSQMAKQQHQLKQHIQVILENYPNIGFTLDQAYRLCEVAIDIGQNREPVDVEIVDELVGHIHQLGANATSSSIHINAWYGAHSKRVTVEYFLQQKGLSEANMQARCCYIGDSLNDVEMFEWLDKSVGVANIRRFWDRLSHKPSIVMNQAGGYGFAEFADQLLTLK